MLIVFSMPVLLLLAIISISLSGFDALLKFALILLAAAYTVYCFRLYKKQAVYVLESNTHGALFLTGDKAQHILEHIVWRDWGFIIELQTILQGKRVAKFWLCAHLNHADLRQLRLLIKAQYRNAANCLPSVVTNPVL